MDATIGLKQKVFMEITFKHTKKGWPMFVVEAKIDGKEYRKFLPTWEGMKPNSVKRLKSELRTMLGAVGGDTSVCDDAFPTAQDFMDAVASAIPEDHADVPVDIFLEYEEKIKEPYTNSAGVEVKPNRTWPEISENFYEGSNVYHWVTSAQKGKYESAVGDNGLEYKTVNGIIHPISRPMAWMSSSRAVVTRDGSEYKPKSEGWSNAPTRSEKSEPALASAPAQRPKPDDDLPF